MKLVGLLLVLAAGTLAAPPPAAASKKAAAKKVAPKPAKRAALYPTVYSLPLAYVSALPPLTAVADLTSYGEGEVKGRIMLIQPVGGAVIMKGNITGLSPGAHGIHVHELGDLSDGCNSLGAHYNPTLNYHGGPADPYRHVGDLGNVMANEEGVANISDSDHLISLTGPHSIIGRGLVIHSGKDDFGRGGDKESLRTGNSGGRVACGVIAWALPPGLDQNGVSTGENKDVELLAQEDSVWRLPYDIPNGQQIFLRNTWRWR